jgi:hypothetical protein
VLTLVEAAGDANGAGQQPALTIANGRITADATLLISPVIASMFINGQVRVGGSSQVLREVRGLEVALVMDNTESMYINNRIGIARTAATNFVDIIGEAASRSSTPQNVRIAMVPFAGTVNVGPANAGATWMDTNAASPIHGQLFSNDHGGAVSANRFTLLSQMEIPWAGCVESRPMPFDVQETAPTASDPSTLIVPYFAPDDMDLIPYVGGTPGVGGVPRNRAQTQLNERFTTMSGYMGAIQPFHNFSDVQINNDYVPDIEPMFHGYNAVTARWGVHTEHALQPKNANAGDDYNNVMFNLLTHMGAQSSDFDDLPMLWRRGTAARMVSKYTKANVDAELAQPVRPHMQRVFTRDSLVVGPNAHCTVRPITRLTSNLGTVRTAISNMTLGRHTNIAMGMMWGWHALSPNAPFADGTAYGAPGNTKVIVMMTDGEQAIGPGGYTGIGFPWQRRVESTGNPAAIPAALNNRLATVCTNIKARGIIIYTVRVEVPGDNTLLQNCATDPGKAYNVSQAADLDVTFKEIARSIQNLRIAA